MVPKELRNTSDDSQEARRLRLRKRVCPGQGYTPQLLQKAARLRNRIQKLKMKTRLQVFICSSVTCKEKISQSTMPFCQPKWHTGFLIS